MPDRYDPHRNAHQPPPDAYDDSVDDDLGGWGTAVLLTVASVVLIPVLAGFRIYDWVHARRKLGKDVHKLLGG